MFYIISAEKKLMFYYLLVIWIWSIVLYSIGTNTNRYHHSPKKKIKIDMSHLI